MGILSKHNIPTKQELIDIGFSDIAIDTGSVERYIHMFMTSYGRTNFIPNGCFTKQFGAVNIIYHGLPGKESVCVRFYGQTDITEKYNVFDINDVISIMHDVDKRYGTFFKHFIKK